MSSPNAELRPEPTESQRNRARWVVPALLAAMALIGYIGFVLGSEARVVAENVSCLSTDEQIGCTLGDGWDVAVPIDVLWVDSSGGLHEGSRPTCLPPTGRGLEGPVRLSWTEVEVDGTTWRQVLHVECLE